MIIFNQYPCPAAFINPDLPIELQEEIKNKIMRYVLVVQFQDEKINTPLSQEMKSTIQFYNPELKDPVKFNEFETKLKFTFQKSFFEIVNELFPKLENDVDLILLFEENGRKFYLDYSLKDQDNSYIQQVIEQILNKIFYEDDDETIDFGDDLQWQEAIDEKTEKVIDEYRKNINDLNEYQQFLITIATKKVLREKAEDLKNSYISKLVVKPDYSIVLPYLNLEIKLNALTKALYIFLLKENGYVALDQLHLYRSEIMDLYLNTSNLSDIDKMHESLDRVLDVSTKSIFTHLSRIKNAFYKEMTEEYARLYVVSGSGLRNRFIPLSKDIIELNI